MQDLVSLIQCTVNGGNVWGLDCEVGVEVIPLSEISGPNVAAMYCTTDIGNTLSLHCVVLLLDSSYGQIHEELR